MAVRDGGFELLTPRGVGGVAVVAVYGQHRWSSVARWLGERPPSSGVMPIRATLVLDGRPADDILLVDRPQLECLELHLHGSPAIVAALEDAVGGFVVTPPGRAEELLRRCRGPEQLALALEQRALDFEGFLAQATAAELRAAAARSRSALAQTTPRRLVLCGEQNAGKSTLMNRLLFAERVLTGAHPGLTRDPVAEGVLLDGYPYEVVDTAGEGLVRDELDRLALARARAERRSGIPLLVIDGSRAPTAEDRTIRDRHERVFVVRSKADLPPAVWPADFAPDLEVACLRPAAAERIRPELGTALRRFLDLPPAGSVGGPAALDATEFERLKQCEDLPVQRGRFEPVCPAAGRTTSIPPNDRQEGPADARTRQA